ncbi:MAG: hypothetical protein LBB65_07150 [Burkholderiales bacterium]|nr:hypothetical protein [Burkholderiales bacterium]
METLYINDGRPIKYWYDYTPRRFLVLCGWASEAEAEAMRAAAGLMVEGKCTVAEMAAAKAAAESVEARLCEAWEAEHGEPRLNQKGRYFGGRHPALSNRLLRA